MTLESGDKVWLLRMFSMNALSISLELTLKLRVSLLSCVGNCTCIVNNDYGHSHLCQNISCLCVNTVCPGLSQLWWTVALWELGQHSSFHSTVFSHRLPISVCVCVHMCVGFVGVSVLSVGSFCILLKNCKMDSWMLEAIQWTALTVLFCLFPSPNPTSLSFLVPP